MEIAVPVISEASSYHEPLNARAFCVRFYPAFRSIGGPQAARPRLVILKTRAGCFGCLSGFPDMLVPIILRGYASIPFEIPADGIIHVSNMILHSPFGRSS
jgi:hypothetical protein